MKNIILSDVCNTLIDLNSTYDYIKFLCKHNYGNKYLGYLLGNYYLGIIFHIFFKITKYDIHRQLTPIYFKKMKKTDLTYINKEFWNFYISKKTKILDRLINYKKKGYKIILISASINPPIDMLGSFLGIDCYSSILEQDKNGVYTGKIKNDLLGNKESLLKSKVLDINKYDNVSFYTDNLSDIGFIKNIQSLSKNSKFFIIIQSGKIKNKRLKLLKLNNITNYEFIS